jgi:hypothetical protein
VVEPGFSVETGMPAVIVDTLLEFIVDIGPGCRRTPRLSSERIGRRLTW